MYRARLIHKEIIRMGYSMQHSNLLMRTRRRWNTFYDEYTIRKGDHTYMLHVKA